MCVCVCVRKCVRWGQLCSRFGALCPKRKHWPVLFLVSAVHSESSAVGNRSHSVSSPVGWLVSLQYPQTRQHHFPQESLIHLLLSIISLRSYTRQLFDSFLDDSVLFTFYIYAVEVFVAVTKSQCPDVSVVRTIESIIPAVDYSWWSMLHFLNVIFNFAGITRYDFYF